MVTRFRKNVREFAIQQPKEPTLVRAVSCALIKRRACDTEYYATFSPGTHVLASNEVVDEGKGSVSNTLCVRFFFFP